MSGELTHVMVGRLIGEAVNKIPNPKINTPFVAAILAFASHGLLDKTDNDYTLAWTAWKDDLDRFEKDRQVLANEVIGIGMQLFTALHNKDKAERDRQLAGILGSIAPDVIEGVYAYLHPDRWNSGDLLFPWHKGGDSKPMQTYEQALQRSTVLTLIGWRVRLP
jgi:hypothetical protein